MDKIELELRGKLRKEADETLFAGANLSDSMKARIRKLAAAEQPAKRRFALPRAWIAGAAAVVAAVVIVAAWPQQTEQSAGNDSPLTAAPSESLPADSGTIGSELSSLVTITLDSADAAAEAFGSGLHVPRVVPEGYTLANIVAVSEQGAQARDVVFTYASGDKSLTVSSSRLDPAFPKELFSQTKIGDHIAYVFEQPEMTELLWTVDGFHYSVVGNVTADEAVHIAESAGK